MRQNTSLDMLEKCSLIIMILLNTSYPELQYIIQILKQGGTAVKMKQEDGEGYFFML